MNGGYTIADVETFANKFYGGRRLLIVPYGYNAVFTNLAQNQTQTITLNIASNADFFLMGIGHRANIGAAQTMLTKTAPFVRVLLTDSGSNEQFTNNAIDLENYSSNGSDTKALPYPRIIAGRSTLQIVVTNFAPTAETYSTLDLYLEGVSIRAYDSGQ